MAVGKLRAMVVDVNDLTEGVRFWSAVSGLSMRDPQAPIPPDTRFVGLSDQPRYPNMGGVFGHSMLLQLVPEDKQGPKNRAHPDFTVDDVQQAADEVVELGGTLKRAPDVYPSDDVPLLEWAVMQDPFGNEFCLIRDLVSGWEEAAQLLHGQDVDW